VARKDPSQWTEAYRHRIERFLEKNPTASLAEARGHKAPRPPEPNLPHQKVVWRETITHLTNKDLLSNISLRERLGKIGHVQAEKDRAVLQRFDRLVEKSRHQKVGSDAFFRTQDQMKRAYATLEKRGYVSEADRKAGKFFYH
jgi:hypothetical protein